MGLTGSISPEEILQQIPTGDINQDELLNIFDVISLVNMVIGN